MTRLATMGAALIAALAAGSAAAQDAGGQSAGGQNAGACGQLAALTQTLREPLRAGFDQRSARLDIPRSEARYLDFTLDGAQPVFLRTETAGAGDPMLALFDVTGATVAWDDDGAGNLNSLLRLDLDGGAYCAQVRLHGAEPTSAIVDLLLSSDGMGFPPPPPGEGPMPCDTAAMQGDLGILGAARLPTSLSGRISPDTGQVAWRLSLTEDTALLIDAVSNDLDTVLTLYDGAGTPAYENDDHPDASGANSRLAEALPAGDWCLAVRPYDAAASGNVLVVMAAPGPDVVLGGGAFMGGPGNFGGTDLGGCGDLWVLPVLAEGLRAGFAPMVWDDVVDENGRADYRMSLAEDLSVQIDAGADVLDTVLTVFDAGGNLLFENDDHPEVIGTNSRLVERLDAGDYCVSVRGFAGAGGAFALSVAMPGDGPDLGGGFGGGFGGGLGESAAVCTGPNTGTLATGFGAGIDAASVGAVVMAEGPADLVLSVAVPMEVQLDATSPAIDTVLELYTLDGTYITENDDDPATGGTDSRIVTRLDAGDYCVRTRGFAEATGPVTVAVALPGAAAPPPAGPDLTLPATFEELGTLGDQPLKSLGLTTDQVLWAAFDLDAEGPVAVQGVSMTAPFTLTLLAADGTEVVAEPSAGDVANARIATDLAPGRYLVALAHAFDLGSVGVRQITVSRP